MTSSLIGEIIEKSISSDTSLAQLLRMVKVAAFRLDLPELGDWVQNELSGYDSNTPDYRSVEGQVVAKSPYHGWIGVGGDPTTLRMLQKRKMAGSIAHLEAMITQTSSEDGAGFCVMPFNPEFVQKVLGRSSSMAETMGTQITTASIIAVLDQVRGKILDWAIEMEKLGVVGEGMTFSRKEKEEAAKATTQIIFSGSIGTFAGNLGTGNSSGPITVSNTDLIEVIQLARNIQSSVPDLIKIGAESSLSTIMDNLTTELEAPSPDKNKVSSFISLAQTALAGASGNLMAMGAVKALEKISSYF